ncbi:nucleotide disphospho-sugar-binding domain-containing protein [Paeniglutamicibacter sulfureus]|uniref:UDP:flavonoid glycosyltransferase YjiC (YdhE family) n=2 Tax=Paeniglutamicibacter sulfureus TaxID=43666 RepID=A0ABU2BFD0_9MICC|nr:nucleotide disphospho-sugar-binding domain-containing protein [Paeniglutamicibacter sulfureus]MDR7356684.1 UDP:flavonoid glycosyltransferase YjiC (YdhE family) [Paeniglutamicibacter sulfureus]
MAGLGSRLQSLGYDVAIAANVAYAPLITAAGCEHRELPGDMSHLVSPAAPGKRPTGADLRRYMDELGDYMDLAATGTLAAAESGAEVILANAIAPYAYDVAEALEIPAIGAHLQPTEPSAAYPPVVLGTARSLGPAGNKLLGSLVSAGKAPYDAPSARIRKALGLGKKSRAAADRLRRKDNSPVLHGISPTIFPRPADWRSGLSLAGYWWPEAEPGWQPPAELLEFLAEGPPPVFIGFGSSAALDADFMLDTVRRSGVRAVLQGVEGVSGSGVIGVGAVPHQWLFPRMAAVVHHAGAGTAAAGLRAGAPTVSVPIYTDQPFWAARITSLGAGPQPVPYKELTTERLAAAITQATATPAYAARARHLAAVLASEDGTAPVVAALRAAGKQG